MKEIARQIFYIPIYNLLIFFAYLTNGSVGWSIILLTVLIRLILLPSSLKAAKATTKMQALQPKMNEIKEKYKDDKQKQTEEMARLYKEEKASPLGACLPLLIQLPILFILYRVFRVGLDTSRYDMLYSFTPRPEVLHPQFFGIDLSKPEHWILPILAGLLQLALSLISMPKSVPNASGKVDPAQAMTKQMTYLFPIMTVFIARSLPAALALYWVITTLFGLGQQWYVNKKLKPQISPLRQGYGGQAKLKTDSGHPELVSGSISGSPIKSGMTDTIEAPKKPKRSDMMTRVMQNRLNKQDRKKGVEITIRKKE